MQFLASGRNTSRHSRLSLLCALLFVFAISELAVAHHTFAYGPRRERSLHLQRLNVNAPTDTFGQPRILHKDACTEHIATVLPVTDVGGLPRSLHQQAPEPADPWPAADDPTAASPTITSWGRDSITRRERFTARDTFAQSPTSRTLDNLLPVILILGGGFIMSAGLIMRARYVMKRRQQMGSSYRGTHGPSRRRRQRQVPLAPLHGAGENEAFDAELLTPRGTRFRPMHDQEESESGGGAGSVFYDVDSPTDGETEDRSRLSMQTASWRGSLGLGQHRMLSIGSFRGHSNDLDGPNTSVDGSSAPLPPSVPMHSDAGAHGGPPNAAPTYRRTLSQASRQESQRQTSRSITGGTLDFGQRIWSTDVSGALDEE